MSSRGKWRLALASGVAFVALGALLWDWRFALYVLVVIGLHEAGHYLAMKWVGYRNLNVFFIPGLGGLATGEKQNATPWEKVFVYLAGPVPGIVLATAGLTAFSAHAGDGVPGASEFLWIMLALNALNLLPITPLDGGRVIEVLLFARWPTLRVGFAAASALLLLLAGWAAGDTVLLIIGVFVAFTLPTQWRFSRLARSVERGSHEALDERSAARRVFAALAQPPFRKWSFAHRVAVGDPLVAELRVALPRARTVAAGLTVYAACFVVPAIAGLAAAPAVRETVAALWEMREIAAQMQADAARAGPPRDWEAELAAAKAGAPDKYLGVLLQATQERGFGEGYGARREEIERLATALPRGNPVRAEALLFVSVVEERTAQSQREQLLALLDELREGGEIAMVARGRVLSALANVTEAPAERLAHLEQAREALSGRVPVGDGSLAYAWTTIAESHALAGEPAAAEREWKALIAWHGTPAAHELDRLTMREAARGGYARFLLESDRTADARALLADAVAEISASAAAGRRSHLTLQSQHVRLLFWIAASHGDAMQARRWLDEWRKSPGVAVRNPQLVLGEMMVADLAADTESARKSRDRLVESAAGKWMCARDLKMLPGARLEGARLQLMERYRVCDQER